MKTEQNDSDPDFLGSPRSAGLNVLRSLVRYRYPILLLSVLLRAVLEGQGTFGLGDAYLFADAGKKLFSSAWSEIYADPGIQAGPIQLALIGSLAALGEITGAGFKMLSSLVIQTGYIAALLFTLRLIAKDQKLKESQTGELTVGLLAVLWGLSWTTFGYGHPAQGFIPILWLISAHYIQRDKPLPAGMLLGLTVGMETWGALGIPVLLFAPSRRSSIRGAAVALGVTIALFGPFVLSGTFNMFEYEWEVQAHAPVSLVLESGSPFGWFLRLVQGAVVLTAGSWVVWKGRLQAAGPILALLTIVSVRLLLDPTLFDYYWLPLQTLALLGGAAAMARFQAASARLGIAAGIYILFLPPLIPRVPVLLLVLVTCLAAVRYPAGAGAAGLRDSRG